MGVGQPILELRDDITGEHHTYHMRQPCTKSTTMESMGYVRTEI